LSARCYISEVLRCLYYLYTASFPSALHSRSDVDGVAPNIVMGFAGTYDPGRDGAMVHAHAEDKMIEGLLIDSG
jgi:hypothetical protein